MGLCGPPAYDADYYPFGQATTFGTTTCSPDFKFATYERDESGLDYAMSRYYSSALGRFISPDMAEDELTLPQSLNRYGYAGGDPIDLRDANGMYPQCDGLGGPGRPGPGNGGNGPGSPPFNPSGKPPLSDETLGFPRGFKWYRPFNLGELIIGPQAYPCDFGVCGSVVIFNAEKANDGSLGKLLHTYEDAEGAFVDRILVPVAMINTGLIVAGASVYATVLVCSTGIGCVLSPVTLASGAGGVLLTSEGGYYLVKHKFFDPTDLFRNKKK